MVWQRKWLGKGEKWLQHLETVWLPCAKNGSFTRGWYHLHSTLVFLRRFWVAIFRGQIPRIADRLWVVFCSRNLQIVFLAPETFANMTCVFGDNIDVGLGKADFKWVIRTQKNSEMRLRGVLVLSLGHPDIVKSEESCWCVFQLCESNNCYIGLSNTWKGGTKSNGNTQRIRIDVWACMEFLYSIVMHLLLEHSSGLFVIKSSHEPCKLFEENYATTMLSSSQIEEKLLLNTSRHPAKDEAWRFSSPPSTEKH